MMSSHSTTTTNVPPLAALEQLTDLKDIHAMLARIDKRRRELDEELTQCTSSSSQMDVKIRRAEQLAISIQPIQDESGKLAHKIAQTSALAESVSSKVRALDRTKDRLNETTKKVEDIIDLKNCIDGVSTAMEESDFETAASHISRFLKLDESVLDPKSTELLRSAEQKLKNVVRVNLNAAMKAKDLKSIKRFCRLHTPLGIADEGALRYSEHLRRTMAKQAEMLLKSMRLAQASLSKGQQDEAAGEDAPASCVDAATQLFELVAQIIEDETPMVEDAFGAGSMVVIIKSLQEEADVHGTAILDCFAEDFQLTKTVNAVTKAVGEPRVDVGHLGLLLDQLALLSQSCETFDHFMRSKARAFLQLDAARKEASRTADGLLHVSALNRRSQELIGGYVALEHCFMRLSMQRATAIYDSEKKNGDGSPADALRDLVDLVFFVAQRCATRALDTANVSSVCAVVNHVNTFLSNDLLNRLKPTVGSTSSLRRLVEDGLRANASLLSSGALAALSLASRHTRQMRNEVAQRAQLNAATTANGNSQMNVLSTSLAELDDTATMFDRHLSKRLVECAENLMPTASAPLNQYATFGHVADEHTGTLSESALRWAADTADSLTALLQPLRDQLEESSFDTFLRHFIERFLNAAEQQLLSVRLDDVGAAQLDADIRLLSSCLQSLTKRSIRDAFARLSQMAMLLNLEKPSDLLEFWGDNAGHMTWRLTPAEVRQVLKQRVDFDRKAIGELKL